MRRTKHFQRSGRRICRSRNRGCGGQTKDQDAADLISRYAERHMLKECPDCHTANDSRLAFCTACGQRLQNRRSLDEWENVLAPYIAVLLLLGVIVALLLYLLS